MKLRRLLRAMLPDRLMISRVRDHRNNLALTFDDGPHAEYTPRLLDLLDRYEARATFFLIGKNIESHRDLVQELVDRGHELGNHSLTHPKISKIDRSRLAHEILATDQLLEQFDGNSRHHFRPPWGGLSLDLLFHANRHRVPVMHWSVDSQDWTKRGADHILQVLSEASLSAGDILLFHDDNQATLDALAKSLPSWREQGLGMATLSELCGRPGRSA